MFVLIHSPCTGSQKYHMTDVQAHSGTIKGQAMKEALITAFRSACHGDK